MTEKTREEKAEKSKARVATGIPGLDALIEGGFPRGRTILVSGGCGTGKSIFGMQYLYRGLVDYEEPGVFVTFDEMPSKIREDMLKFGWSLKELEKNDLLAILDATSAKAGTASEEEHALTPGKMDFDTVLLEVLNVCRKTSAKRLVIDSIPAMGLHSDSLTETRRNILKLAYVLNRTGLTTILTTETPESAVGSGAMHLSRYGVEEYIADGVILLSTLAIGSQVNRALYVRKMRGTKHDMGVHPMEITEKGIVVKKMEDVFK
ncbi:MAG: ATPase domain-containing protein [Candidatus Norongarragalinales archaeon]